MRRTLVLDVVGMTPALLAHAPNLKALAERGAVRPLTTVVPAVTTTVQSTFVTGALPRGHGAVANGWYFRDLAEIWLWRQINRLVGGEKVWEAAKRRDPSFTCAKLFWWYNMYATADWSVTPRPMYPADGRKLPDIYTHPAELRDELQRDLGQFPLFKFWGPAADIESHALDRQAARCACSSGSDRRSRSCTCRTSTTTCSASARRIRRSRATSRQVDEICGELIDAARRAGCRGRRALRVRHHGRLESRAHQPGAAAGRMAARAGRARTRAARRRRVRCVRRRGSPARPRLCRATGARARGRQRCCAGFRGSSACSTKRASASSASTIRAQANWSPSPGPTAGSPTITSWTTRARRTMRAPSTSTASRATTRWNCSSIRN